MISTKTLRLEPETWRTRYRVREVTVEEDCHLAVSARWPEQTILWVRVTDDTGLPIMLGHSAYSPDDELSMSAQVPAGTYRIAYVLHHESPAVDIETTVRTSPQVPSAA